MIFECIKNNYIISRCLKIKYNEDFLIVTNSDLDIFYLNNTAKRVFELATGKNTIQKVVTIMLGEYDVDENELKNDLINIIRDFQWKNIMEISETEKYVKP